MSGDKPGPPAPGSDQFACAPSARCRPDVAECVQACVPVAALGMELRKVTVALVVDAEVRPGELTGLNFDDDGHRVHSTEPGDAINAQPRRERCLVAARVEVSNSHV